MLTNVKYIPVVCIFYDMCFGKVIIVRKRKFKVLDLFAGAGGFSYGFRNFRVNGKAPFEIAGYVENDPNAVRTLVAALIRDGMDPEKAKKITICEDIMLSETQRTLYSVCPEVDVIIGGPPCQSFSMIGPRSGDDAKKERFRGDHRDSLFSHYIQLVDHYRPAFFVFENVTGILSKKTEDTGQKYIDMIISSFEDIGYDMSILEGEWAGAKYMVLNAADYGVPQLRHRVIIIGNRMKVPNPVPKPTHCPPEQCAKTGRLPYVTLLDAIGDLPPLQAKYTLTTAEKGTSSRKVSSERRMQIDEWNRHRFSGVDPASYQWDRFNAYYEKGNESRRRFLDFIRPKQLTFELTGHIARRQQETDILLFEKMKPGSSSHDLLDGSDPENSQLLSLIKYGMKSFQDKYKKLSWDFPCGTIFAHLQKDGNRFIHPDSNQARTLTVREAARIQSFPDDYVFEAEGNIRYKQIGNAVAPLLAMAIAAALYKSLKEHLGTMRNSKLQIAPSESRSRNMAAIKSRNTGPEIKLRKALFAAGFRFRLREKITGLPDIVFKRQKVAVFVDGCFWHRCPECYKKPVSNEEFWEKKVEANVRRDREVDELLKSEGWKVIRIWEHAIKRDVNSEVAKINTILNQSAGDGDSALGRKA